MSRFINHDSLTCSLLALLFLSGSFVSAQANSTPSEMTGTRKVMRVIHNVNLPRAEQKALQDILDIKGQLYSQNPLLIPATAITAPSRHRMPDRH